VELVPKLVALFFAANKLSLFYKMCEIDEVRPIEGFDDYVIARDGKITRLSNGISLSQSVEFKSYPRVNLQQKDGKWLKRFVHRLVAKAWIPNPHGHPFVNHLDRNKSNCHMSNLEWCSASENVKHWQQNFVWKQSRPVFQLDLAGNIKCRYPSAQAAAVSATSTNTKSLQRHISACCAGKRKTAGGHKWKYEEPLSHIDCSNLDGEVWQAPVTHPMFEVSNKGRVKRRKTGQLATLYENVSGYFQVQTNRKDLGTRLVHRIVAETFIPNPHQYEVVDHINRDRKDNTVDNLRWVSATENTTLCLGRKITVRQGDSKKKYPSVTNAAKGLGVPIPTLFSVLKNQGRITRSGIWNLVSLETDVINSSIRYAFVLIGKRYRHWWQQRNQFLNCFLLVVSVQ